MEAIPASLADDAVMGRLDQLSAAKEVAQRAAVLGREFGYPLLAAMAGMDEAVVFVQPRTVITWQRKGFREYWMWLSRRGRVGRPLVEEGDQGLDP